MDRNHESGKNYNAYCHAYRILSLGLSFKTLSAATELKYT
jgi:hypothetical protein